MGCHNDTGSPGHGPHTHVLLQDDFWAYFEQQVRAKTWSCHFGPGVLTGSVERDASLYQDDTALRKRREGVLRYIDNDTLWTNTVLGACREVADGVPGPHSTALRDLRMLEALSDYVAHLDFFHQVALEMESLGQSVRPLGQDSSLVHDIDKLDPVMLVGYSERFEDNVSTSVWDLCVDRHTRVNPHHQAHCMWHDCCQDGCGFCEGLRTKALREMVCDKVSRRVQKDLGGRMSSDMWNVSLDFFRGLPEDWLDKARDLMLALKG